MFSKSCTFEIQDYINSARAFAKIAKYFEKNKTQNFLEFKFFGITARWMDIYFENWDKVYEKFQTKSPKELVCLRGLFASIGKPYKDKNGYEWIHIKLKKTAISTNVTSETFAQIKLFKPMFEKFLEQLEEAKRKSEHIEITFFGKIERYVEKHKRNCSIKKADSHREKKGHFLTKCMVVEKSGNLFYNKKALCFRHKGWRLLSTV